METNTEVKRVAFYIRVSTDEQVREGYGPEFQEDALDRLIEFKSTQSPKWITSKKHLYIDSGYSGGDLRRPKFQEMMKAAKNKEFDIIAVWKIDRMSRNLSHLLKTFEELRGYGVSFFSLKENIDFSGPVGRLTFQIFGALAEFEREMIKSRTTEGKKASARRGNYTGNAIPYGYKPLKTEGEKGTKLVAVAKEKKILKQIFNWFVFDKYTYSDIAKKLDALKIPKGVASRRRYQNSKWYPETIKGMLENPIYLGTRIDKFKDDEGSIEKILVKVPPLIEENIFDFAQVRIADIESKKERKKVGGGKNEYLLSRMIVDVDTQKCLIGYTRNGGTYGYRRKKVIDKNTGAEIYENVEITGNAIDSFVWKQVKTAIQRPEKLYLMFQKQVSTGNDLERFKDELRLCKQKIEKQEEIIDNIHTDHQSGTISTERRDRLILNAENILRNTEIEATKLESKIDNLIKTMYAKEHIVNITKNYSKNLENLSLKQKKVIIQSLIDKIYAKKKSDGKVKLQIIFKFDPEKIGKISKKVELKNSTSTSKSKGAKYACCVNGGSSEARTQDLLLKRELLYQLS